MKLGIAQLSNLYDASEKLAHDIEALRNSDLKEEQFPDF
jgi:hypothetical protein